MEEGRLDLETELLVVYGILSLRDVWIILVILCLPCPLAPFGGESKPSLQCSRYLPKFARLVLTFL